MTSGQSIANVKVVMGYNIHKSTRKKMNILLKAELDSNILQ